MVNHLFKDIWFYTNTIGFVGFRNEWKFLSINPLDVGFVAARYSCSYPDDGPACLDADVNGDGAVDPLDTGFVLARFGECL